VSCLDISSIEGFAVWWRYTCCYSWPRWAKVRWPHFLPLIDPQVSTSIKSWWAVTCESLWLLSCTPFSGVRLETTLERSARAFLIVGTPTVSSHLDESLPEQVTSWFPCYGSGCIGEWSTSWGRLNKFPAKSFIRITNFSTSYYILHREQIRLNT